MELTDLREEQILISPDAPAIGVHAAQAARWLRDYRNAPSQMALVYSAVELRLEIERLVIEVLRVVGTSSLERSNFHETISSLRGIEAKIYDLLGYQREIDRKIEFLNLFEQAIGGSRIYPSLQVGQLRRMWHEVSEYCHVQWTLRFEQEPIQAAALESIERNLASVDELVSNKPGWIGFCGETLPDLMRRYVDGAISPSEVQNDIRKMGITTETVVYDRAGRATRLDSDVT